MVFADRVSQARGRRWMRIDMRLFPAICSSGQAGQITEVDQPVHSRDGDQLVNRYGDRCVLAASPSASRNTAHNSTCIVMSKRFLRSMAQPFEHDQTGVSLWSLEHIEARQAAVREAAEGGRTLEGADQQVAESAAQEAEGWYEGFDDADIIAIEDAESAVRPAKKSRLSELPV